MQTSDKQNGSIWHGVHQVVRATIIAVMSMWTTLTITANVVPPHWNAGERTALLFPAAGVGLLLAIWLTGYFRKETDRG